MKLKVFSVILITFLLSACNDSLQDINSFMDRVKQQPVKQIEPLPQIQPQQTFEYAAYDSRDPFSNDLEAEDNTADLQAQQLPAGEGPDLQRRKEYLESFPLDSMGMVGTYQQGDDYWGLVVDPEGVIHRALVGEYLGQNYGEIIAITAAEIVVEEWINDGLGAWTKREAKMALNEE
ncbi:pilus assembly protein PilP [Marinicella sp. W31]|uniref:pilus assembly protein PilP n=1 Tax=Marinicella sp. W31 TaxID=3023713 RepID=UPI0037573D08